MTLTHATVVDHWRSRIDDLSDALEYFVRLEAGSREKSRVDALADVFADRMAYRGFRVDVIDGGVTGNHVRAVREGSGASKVLVLVHLDTVWPAGAFAADPYVRDGDLARGPGVLDMKGGWVVLLSALDSLADLGWPGTRELVVLATGDEELGTPNGRRWVEADAADADLVLVMEPSRDGGRLVGARGAVGAMEITVAGINSHASSDDPGASAVREAARIITEVEALNDRRAGIVVNVGIVSGGQARQVVPDKAWMSVDLRAPDEATSSALLGSVHDVLAGNSTPGTTVTTEGGITRPAFHSANLHSAAVKRVSEIAKELDVPGEFVSTRGGSDGNFAAALGVATVDGLGPFGSGICTRDETVALSSLPGRIALLTNILEEASRGVFGADESGPGSGRRSDG